MFKKIRKNAHKKITAILKNAALLSQFKYDDMTSTERDQVTVAYVLDMIQKYYDDVEIWAEMDDQGNVDLLQVRFHRNWSITAYASKEIARANLTDIAFTQYFPVQPESVQAPKTERQEPVSKGSDEIAPQATTEAPVELPDNVVSLCQFRKKNLSESLKGREFSPVDPFTGEVNVFQTVTVIGERFTSRNGHVVKFSDGKASRVIDGIPINYNPVIDRPF